MREWGILKHPEFVRVRYRDCNGYLYEIEGEGNNVNRILS